MSGNDFVGDGNGGQEVVIGRLIPEQLEFLAMGQLVDVKIGSQRPAVVQATLKQILGNRLIIGRNSTLKMKLHTFLVLLPHFHNDIFVVVPEWLTDRELAITLEHQNRSRDRLVKLERYDFFSYGYSLLRHAVTARAAAEAGMDVSASFKHLSDLLAVRRSILERTVQRQMRERENQGRVIINLGAATDLELLSIRRGISLSAELHAQIMDAVVDGGTAGGEMMTQQGYTATEDTETQSSDRRQLLRPQTRL